MTGKQNSVRSTHPRFWASIAALCGAAALVLTGCAPGGGGDVGANGGTSSTQPPPATAAPDSDTDSELDDDAPVLGHDDALAAGFDHTAAIKCGYTYGEQELAWQRAVNPTAELVPEATIYLDRGVIYWDMPQPDGRTSHMLALDGYLYTWKVPSDSDAVKNTDATNGGADGLAERLDKNAHDCVVYDGPASIFEPPQGIPFTTIG